jgi:hypothetical protein
MHMALFEPKLNPRTKAHVAGEVKPPKTVKEHAGEGFNAFLAVKITTAVGTMACAYIFTAIALFSLPSILKQAGFGIGFDLGDGTVLIVSWIAQTFIQLVLLSIIIVGQNIQAKASDERAANTYKDADATLHEAEQLQKHLLAQDAHLEKILGAAGDILKRLQDTGPPKTTTKATT